MPRFKQLQFDVSDPGVAASAAQRWDGGSATLVFTYTAAASSTVTDLQISFDGTTYVDLDDRNGAQVTISANGVAGAVYFNLGELSDCLVRLNTTGGGGATTTGTCFVRPSKNRTNG